MAEFTWSDAFGVAGAACLLVAPARDLFMRYCVDWFRKQETAAQAGNKMAKIFSILATTFEDKRNSWHTLDAVATITGAICLGISYSLT